MEKSSWNQHVFSGEIIFVLYKSDRYGKTIKYFDDMSITGW
jgi:hypothetical protein